MPKVAFSLLIQLGLVGQETSVLFFTLFFNSICEVIKGFYPCNGGFLEKQAVWLAKPIR